MYLDMENPVQLGEDSRWVTLGIRPQEAGHKGKGGRQKKRGMGGTWLAAPRLAWAGMCVRDWKAPWSHRSRFQARTLVFLLVPILFGQPGKLGYWQCPHLPLLQDQRPVWALGEVYQSKNLEVTWVHFMKLLLRDVWGNFCFKSGSWQKHRWEMEGRMEKGFIWKTTLSHRDIKCRIIWNLLFPNPRLFLVTHGPASLAESKSQNETWSHFPFFSTPSQITLKFIF